MKKILEIPNDWVKFDIKNGFTLSKGHRDYKEYLKEGATPEKLIDFSPSGKKKNEIVEFLKTLEVKQGNFAQVKNKIYIFTLEQGKTITNYEVVIGMIEDNVIGIESLNGNFPTNREFLSINFDSNVYDNTIKLDSEIIITNIKEKPTIQNELINNLTENKFYNPDKHVGKLIRRDIGGERNCVTYKCDEGACEGIRKYPNVKTIDDYKKNFCNIRKCLFAIRPPPGDRGIEIKKNGKAHLDFDNKNFVGLCEHCGIDFLSKLSSNEKCGKGMMGGICGEPDYYKTVLKYLLNTPGLETKGNTISELLQKKVKVTPKLKRMNATRTKSSKYNSIPIAEIVSTDDIPSDSKLTEIFNNNDEEKEFRNFLNELEKYIQSSHSSYDEFVAYKNFINNGNKSYFKGQVGATEAIQISNRLFDSFGTSPRQPKWKEFLSKQKFQFNMGHNKLLEIFNTLESGNLQCAKCSSGIFPENVESFVYRMFPVILKYIENADKLHNGNIGETIIPKVKNQKIIDKVDINEWEFDSYKGHKYIDYSFKTNWVNLEETVNNSLKNLNASRKDKPQIIHSVTQIPYPGGKIYKNNFKKFTLKLPKEWSAHDKSLGLTRTGPNHEKYMKNHEEDNKYYTNKGDKCIANKCPVGPCKVKGYNKITSESLYINKFCNPRPSLYVVRPEYENKRKNKLNFGVSEYIKYEALCDNCGPKFMWYLTNDECSKKIKNPRTCEATRYYKFLIKTMLSLIGFDGETAYDCMVKFLSDSLDNKNVFVNPELNKPVEALLITDDARIKELEEGGLIKMGKLETTDNGETSDGETEDVGETEDIGEKDDGDEKESGEKDDGGDEMFPPGTSDNMKKHTTYV